jgi:hypothetical protein
MTPREQIEALAAEMESGWGAAQTSLASFALDTAARLRAVLASWTPPDEKLVSPGASSPPVPAPTTVPAAGCDESVREAEPCACGEWDLGSAVFHDTGTKTHTHAVCSPEDPRESSLLRMMLTTDEIEAACRARAVRS